MRQAQIASTEAAQRDHKPAVGLQTAPRSPSISPNGQRPPPAAVGRGALREAIPGHRQGAAAVHPVEERRRRPPSRSGSGDRLPPCPLRIQCESQSPILLPPLTLPSSSALVPQPSWSAAAASWRGRDGSTGYADLGPRHTLHFRPIQGNSYVLTDN